MVWFGLHEFERLVLHELDVGTRCLGIDVVAHVEQHVLVLFGLPQLHALYEYVLLAEGMELRERAESTASNANVSRHIEPCPMRGEQTFKDEFAFGGNLVSGLRPVGRLLLLFRVLVVHAVCFSSPLNGWRNCNERVACGLQKAALVD